ncbi:putative ribonuclease H-like domain-containing protein [Tanacetum coccineum]
MKAVIEKEQLQKIVDSWKDSSKNLWKLVNSGMTSNSKVGLGYGIKSDNEVLSYEEEMNYTVFNCTEEYFIDKPLYNRFSKTDNFKGVPHPLTGDYTPKQQQEIDESLYVYGKKGPQKHKTSVSYDKFNKYSTCQSNDSAGSFGNTSKHSVEFESEIISTAVKTLAGYNWRNTRPNSNCNSGSNLVRTVNAKGPTKNMEEQSIFESEASPHMTVNKDPDRCDDFEECKGGSVTFGGSKGYITGKGQIRVSNLEFDSVSFVKELGHFNLFSISQLCDKQHKVLFTETKCLVVSPDFKIPDENQILLKNRDMLEFYRNKGIKQEYNNTRTPQQNGVAERMNRTLIEAARTMLADSLLPTTFWAEADSQQSPTKTKLLGDLNHLSKQDAYAATFRTHYTCKVRVQGDTRKDFESSKRGLWSLKARQEEFVIIKQKTDGLFISQDKYVTEMLKKFDLASVKTAITLMETMALTKDEEADDVDVHLYRSMIVTPNFKLNAVKRIFKYLKGKPNLGLWYPRESPFDLEAYSDSDYAGANLDRKSTTVLWTSVWIQNQMLDYGFNFMNTKIHIDNESTICIVKNPAYHSKTKHIEIKHHFIQDYYEKKLIRVEKIYTDFNVADLLTKSFDGLRGFRGVPRPLLPTMLLVVAVDQGARQAYQVVIQPSLSEPLPSSSPPPVISATTESEPTPIVESTTNPNLLSLEPDNEPIEPTFEQPSSEHQPLSPR